jgi:phenylpyruvate tautomerase PptA (4-oxalocrotonate tautomerase family)
MPIYTVTAPAGSLTDAQKKSIAEAITRIHVEVTDAPSEFVNTLFNYVGATDQYVAGVPSSPILIFGHIREGRSDADKQRLLKEIVQACAEITDRGLAEFGMAIRDIPSKYLFEGGRIMPEPGHEAEWLAAGES